MKIFDEISGIAGTIDMIFKDENGKLVLFDWKRSKKISKYNIFNKYSTSDFMKHIPDTNYWHYSLQLHAYRYILSKHYFKDTDISKDMHIVVFHPNNKNYIKIKVANVSKEIALIMDKEKMQK